MCKALGSQEHDISAMRYRVLSSLILVFVLSPPLSPLPQVLYSQTKIHQKWMRFVPLLLDLPDPNVTMRGLENGREPRKYYKI